MKLLDRVREALRRRYALRTEDAYLHWKKEKGRECSVEDLPAGSQRRVHPRPNSGGSPGSLANPGH